MNSLQKFSLATIAMSAIAITLVSGSKSASASEAYLTCESNDYQCVDCLLTGRYDDVELDRQLSEKSCRGRWGKRRNYIWVEDGCRARFILVGDDDHRYDHNSRYDRDNHRYEEAKRRDRYRDYYEDLNKIYRDVLGRDIDRRGYRTYRDRFRDGWSWTRIRKDISTSREAKDAINNIYREVLGRDADREGMRTYQRRLEDGWSLRQVKRAISRSREARERR